MIDNEFRPPIGRTEHGRYKMHINWASIYAGHVKIILSNGQPLRAELEDKYDKIRS